MESFAGNVRSNQTEFNGHIARENNEQARTLK